MTGHDSYFYENQLLKTAFIAHRVFMYLVTSQHELVYDHLNPGDGRDDFSKGGLPYSTDDLSLLL